MTQEQKKEQKKELSEELKQVNKLFEECNVELLEGMYRTNGTFANKYNAIDTFDDMIQKDMFGAQERVLINILKTTIPAFQPYKNYLE